MVLDLGLKDRRYLVTGGSQGLGYAVAKALVGEGARMLIAARSRERLDRARRELGDLASTATCDLADEEAPARLLARAEEAMGGLDGGFVSHGGPPASSALGLEDATLRAAVDGALIAPIRVMREVAAALQPGGAIVLLASTSARQPLDGMIGSNLARPGAWGYAKSLAGEVGPRGVRVNCVIPGSFATGRLAEVNARMAAQSGRSPEEVAEARTGAIPLRRFGDPEELGRVAAFLLSPAASYVTGSAWAVDGGVVRGL